MMNKTIEYYLKLPYTREVIPEPGGIWFVRIKELPNCMSQGNSPEEAFQNINQALHGWLETELEDGEDIPEPRHEGEYSGKFVVRVPKTLHRKISETADQEGVSLNQWINAALAEAIGNKLAQIQMAGAKPLTRVLLEEPHRYEAGTIRELKPRQAVDAALPARNASILREKTHAEQILWAVNQLTRQGKNTFARMDIRDLLGLSQEAMGSFNPVIQGMRIDQPGGAPKVDERFRNVFQRVERGLFRLTEYGKRLIKELFSD